MANNYTESSSWLDIPADKIDEAKDIIARVEEEIEATAECGIGCLAEIKVKSDSCGVWFHGDESFDADHCEQIARALVEELKLDGPFLCSWCYLCSKPRINEFGGGAFILARGMDTYWVDGQMMCNAHYDNWRKQQERQ